jgi:hypothetical protein
MFWSRVNSSWSQVSDHRSSKWRCWSWLAYLEVLIMICWTSRQVSEGLASSVRAIMAAAIGALALVPAPPRGISLGHSQLIYIGHYQLIHTYSSRAALCTSTVICQSQWSLVLLPKVLYVVTFWISNFNDWAVSCLVFCLFFWIQTSWWVCTLLGLHYFIWKRGTTTTLPNNAGNKTLPSST